MADDKQAWDADRLAVWIKGLMMPTSSQSLSRPHTVDSGPHINPLQLPDGEVSFIALNKAKVRPSQVFIQKKGEVDKLSIFMERVAGEIGPETLQKTERNRKRVCEILGEVLQMAFALEPRFMRAFEMPPLSLMEDDIGLESVSFNEFNCRLFLHKFEHPDAISTTSGVQDDLPPGVALCRVSDKITAPEQMRTKHTMGVVMDELGYVSPSRIYPWFAKGITAAAQMVLQKRRNIFRDDCKEDIKVDLQFPQTTLEFTSSGSDIIVVNVFPAIRGTGWPRGAILQHGLPKQRRYAECGQLCLNEITGRIDDGQTMWYLEAKPVHLDPALQKKARFRGGLRKIFGGVDRFWHISLAPAHKVILDSACVRAESEYQVRIGNIRHVLIAIAQEHCWQSLTPMVLDTHLLWTVKRSLADSRAQTPFFFEVLKLLRRTLLQGSCPDFLMPNVNAAEPLLNGFLEHEDAAVMAAELGLLISDLRQRPSELLRYVGYTKPGQGSDPRAARFKSASTRKSRTHSRQSSNTTIHSSLSKPSHS